MSDTPDPEDESPWDSLPDNFMRLCAEAYRRNPPTPEQIKQAMKSKEEFHFYLPNIRPVKWKSDERRAAADKWVDEHAEKNGLVGLDDYGPIDATDGHVAGQTHAEEPLPLCGHPRACLNRETNYCRWCVDIDDKTGVAEARLMPLLESLLPVHCVPDCSMYVHGTACDCGTEKLQDELQATIKRIRGDSDAG